MMWNVSNSNKGQNDMFASKTQTLSGDGKVCAFLFLGLTFSAPLFKFEVEQQGREACRFELIGNVVEERTVSIASSVI
jgi:hypothetical protein